MSSEIAGIEIVEQGPPLQQEDRASEASKMISQIASAVENARSANSRTPSPNALEDDRRMVVQNSASALDHPVILRNQRDLINHSMQNETNEVQETEFSFRENHKES